MSQNRLFYSNVKGMNYATLNNMEKFQRYY